MYFGLRKTFQLWKIIIIERRRFNKTTGLLVQGIELLSALIIIYINKI